MCRSCKTITPRHQLEYEFLGKSITQRGHCPACGTDAFDEVIACDECRKHPALPHDDVCSYCKDLEEERDFDLDMAEVRRTQPDKDLLDTMISIARGEMT